MNMVVQKDNNCLQEIAITSTAGKSYSWAGAAKSTKQEFSLRETKEQTKKDMMKFHHSQGLL